MVVSLSPHSFSPCISASFMIEDTGDIYLCSKLLGYSSVKTTQRYTKVTDKSLMDGVKSI